MFLRNVRPTKSTQRDIPEDGILLVSRMPINVGASMTYYLMASTACYSDSFYYFRKVCYLGGTP
jgi:hypothetical protein